MPSPLTEKHSLDVPRAISIEFPANVQNVPRALSLIGGPSVISRATDKQEPLQLRFRPDDPFEHPINSRVTKHQNILLKIDIPKKFLNQASGDVHQALKLAKGDYTVKPERILESNFRFREMSDFQRNTSNSAFLSKVRPSIFAGSLKEIQKLSLEGLKEFDEIPGDIDAMPPPRISQVVFPFNYAYRQNPAVTIISDETGKSRLINNSVSQRLHSVMIGWDDSFPESPPDSLPENPEMAVSLCIDKVKELFDKRPLWTRKGVENNIHPDLQSVLKKALPYVAYFFKSGPYRSAYAKYGVDPRSSSKYAQYQTEHFRILREHGEISSIKSEEPNETFDNGNVSMNIDAPDSDINHSSYIFDGIHVLTGRVVQLCDVTDPQIQPLITSARINEECNRQYDGWYYSEDIDIIRRVLRAKLLAVKRGQTIDNSFIDRVIKDKKTKHKATLTQAKEALLERVSLQGTSHADSHELKNMLEDMEEDDDEDDDEDYDDDNEDGSILDVYDDDDDDDDVEDNQH